MKLFLVRHGEAVIGNPLDSTRSLTERGFGQAQWAAEWLKSVMVGPVDLWVSPYLRTQQTAQPIAEALNVNAKTYPWLQPETPPREVMDALLGANTNVVLVTHLPLVGRLASLLTEGIDSDLPWSPAEIWQLEGAIFAANCLSKSNVWYPS